MSNDRSVWMTSKSERTSYGLYFMGQNAVYTFQFLFLATFLLMSGLDALATAGIMMAVKVWDAINDCLFGGIIDNVRFKKGLKFLPWLRLSLPLIAVSFILLFAIPQVLGVNAKLVWFAVAYIMFDIAYTICDVPIFGMVTTMTEIQAERTSLMATGRIFANFGVIIAMIVGFTLTTEAVGLSFSASAVIITVIAVLSMVWICFKGKEHVAKPKESSKSYGLKQMFTYLARNKFLLIYFTGLLLFSGLNTATVVVQFTSFYLFNSAMIATLLGAIAFAPVVVVALLVPRVLKKVDKFKLFLVNTIAFTVLSIIIWIVGPHIIPHVILMTIRGFAFGFISVLQFMFTPDCAEYGQYKTGTDAKGITFAIQTFTMKLVSAISASLAVGVLGLFGWVSINAASFAELAEMNIQQPSEALSALWAVYALIPAIGAVLAIVFWSRYRLKSVDVELMARYNNGEITREQCDAQLSQAY